MPSIEQRRGYLIIKEALMSREGDIPCSCGDGWASPIRHHEQSECLELGYGNQHSINGVSNLQVALVDINCNHHRILQ